MSTVTIEKKMTTLTTIETKETECPTEENGTSKENGDTSCKKDSSPPEENGKSDDSKDGEKEKSEEKVKENRSDEVKENGAKPKNKSDEKEGSKQEDKVLGDQAVLTNFLPGDVFECSMGDDCVVGDKTATEGNKKMEYKARQWHEKCFCCVVCKTPIGTKSFIPREQEIYCTGCYEEKFATRCIKCSKIITSGGVTYKNEPWHRECFTCTNCDASLAGQRFTSRDDKPYCADCFGDLFAKRCTACTKPITGIGGTRFISFEDRHWHNDCFICANCNNSLVGKGFITDGSDILCPECAKQKLT